MASRLGWRGTCRRASAAYSPVQLQSCAGVGVRRLLGSSPLAPALAVARLNSFIPAAAGAMAAADLYHASSAGTQALVAVADDPACLPPVQGGERLCTAPAAWGTLPKSAMPGLHLTLFPTSEAVVGARCRVCPMRSSGECGGVMRHGSACWWAGECRAFSLHETAAQFCVLGPGRTAGQGRRAGREA